ncbi:MAG: MFS transporter [Pirellulales bacterium]
MSFVIVLWAIVSALAGFLFRFDTVVISGAEKTTQELWGTDPCHARRRDCFGALRNSDRRVGRGLATGAWTFCIARFIGGIGVGISTVAAPLSISEISPPAARGRLTGLLQFNIVFGILAAFFSKWMHEGMPNH